MKRLCVCSCTAVLCCFEGSGLATTGRPAPDAVAPRARQETTNQHDFDFVIGTWTMRVARLTPSGTESARHPPTDGTVVARAMWHGRENLEESEGPRPTDAAELVLRLYNRQSPQWNLYRANTEDATLSWPMVGQFTNGIGEFFDQEVVNGRLLLVRHVYSHVTPTSYEIAEGTSDDGGDTWVPAWTATLTRHVDHLIEPTASAADRSRDFDFNIGTFATHVSRLQHPLSGSKTWLHYEGTSFVRPVWGGRASLFKPEVDATAGHIEGAGLRLYSRRSRQWSLNWANSEDGVMTHPMVGAFKDGRGDFFDQEIFGGRTIFARNRFVGVTMQSARFEQDFSVDGGRTWETNWVMTFTRIKETAADKKP